MGANNTSVATLKNIENVEIQAAAAAAGLNASSWEGVTGLTFKNSTNAATVSNVKAIPSVTVESSNGGNLTVNLLDSVVAGTSDSVNVTLNGMTDTTVRALTIKGATAGGVETWNINSTGANNKVDLSGNVGMKTVVVTGDKTLDASSAALATTVTSVDASAQTAGGVKFNLAGSTLTSVKGGAGSDTFLLGATAVGTTVIDGGAGTDTLGLNAANVVAALATTSKISNIETLQVQNASTLTAATTYNLANVTGLQNLTFGGTLTVDDGATNTYTQTVNGLQNGSTVRFNDGIVNAASGGTPTDNASIVLNVKGAASSASDVLNIVMAKGATTAAAENFIGATIANVETLAFDIKSLTGNTTTISGVADAQLTTLTLKSSAVDATGAAAKAANLTTGAGFDTTLLTTVDASEYSAAATGVVNVTSLSGNLIATGATITGPASGILVATGGAGADTIITGAGGSNSSTGLTGGAGADSINITASAAKVDLITVARGDSTYTAYDSITGFTMSADGTVADKLDIAATAVMADKAAGTTTGITGLTAQATNGIITFGGTAAATATLEQLFEATGNLIGTNTHAAAFVYNGDTYLFDSDGAAALSAQDIVIKLAGVTTATALSTTAADTAILIG